jgi:hypothetical protein
MKLKNTLWRLGDVTFVGELVLTHKRFRTVGFWILDGSNQIKISHKKKCVAFDHTLQYRYRVTIKICKSLQGDSCAAVRLANNNIFQLLLSLPMAYTWRQRSVPHRTDY